MAPRDIKDLLLAERLETGEVEALLRPYGFADVPRADENLQAMADDPRARRLLAEILEELLSLLSEAPDPDNALNHIERFAQASLNRIALFSYLKDSPRTLELLVKTVWASPFMTEILIRDPEYLYWVTDARILERGRSRREIQRDLSGALRNIRSEDRRLDILRAVKRKEILRIGVRDLMGIADVEETVSSLSVLGEALIHRVYEICDASMRREFGVPSKRARGGWVRPAFTVLGMGKLGGGELNFSSDVDLIFLRESDGGRTRAPGEKEPRRSVTNGDYFNDLARRITRSLSEATDEGYLYRVDLRLRPEGNMGEMTTSLAGFKRYYGTRGENWERMALTKAWPVGGDTRLGERFLRGVRPFLFDPPFDGAARREVRNIKERIDGKIRARGEEHRHVKLGFGGIREIEFVAQALQITHGKRHPRVRQRGTLKTLSALERLDLLGGSETRDLATAYRFLRDVENKIQMVYDVQVYAIPEEAEALRALAFRLNYRDGDRGKAEEAFMEDYRRHTARVHSIFGALLSESSERPPQRKGRRRALPPRKRPSKIR